MQADSDAKTKQQYRLRVVPSDALLLRMGKNGAARCRPVIVTWQSFTPKKRCMVLTLLGIIPYKLQGFWVVELPSDKPLVFTVLLVTLELMFQLSYEIWQFGVEAICLLTTWVYGNVNGFFQTKGRVGGLPMHPNDVWLSLLWLIVTYQPVRI